MKRALKILLPILVLSIGIGVFAALRATKPVQVAAKIEERVWRVQVMAVEPRRLWPSCWDAWRPAASSSLPATPWSTNCSVRSGAGKLSWG